MIFMLALQYRRIIYDVEWKKKVDSGLLVEERK